MFLQGIDVSDHQGKIDWGTVARQGVAFAYAKATEGGTWTDPTFAANYAGIRDAGMLRGAYHYLRPHTAASEQVANFLKTLGPRQAGDLPPMLDLEAVDGMTGAAIVQCAVQWLDQVQAALRCSPLVYCDRDFWTHTLDCPAALEEFPFWIAEYNGNELPTLPRGQTSFAFWQYAQSGKVAGIAAARSVDLDWFNGTREQLAAMGMTADPDAAGPPARADA
ncbi:hypothetical protein F2P45_12900 [Massilia sp. CCM 8733]|uniref:Lyzozyme M1 n=1 Tax=Massilia mucilaginosa TaxID=2609282 RepID=A0ABX0NSZ0_9BURK|nr:GH25 family lysozyme [Massilia mucilaginosa]NHZ89905.1 hypothetical protein [Massilia mucilaginosa]